MERYRYDPERAPDPEAWLALDDLERIARVAAHHRRTRVKLGNLQLHAMIHAVVENQLAERIPSVQTTLERLMGEGLGRHEVIHAIGSAVTECLWNALREPPRPEDLAERYFRRLETLTATEWLESAG